MAFVDDTVLDVFPPVEKGKRSRKAETLLEALSLALSRSRGVVRWDRLLVLWERMHWIVESSVYIWLAEAWLASQQTAELDEKFTQLWLKLKEEYIHERKQRSDLLRLAMKEYGDAFVEAVSHEIDGSPARLLDTEVCFDPAVPFCPLINLPWFPKMKNWVAEINHIDGNEPWRNWWLTTPGRHPYNTIFRPAHPDFPLFVPVGADPEIVQLVVEAEREVIEPVPPALHPKTRPPANRPTLAGFLPPNVVHAA
ncbi:hypothetical protein PHYSODRAFT_330518 [Phytophthora sojae]|uniref:Uncharacterized protein n=1 Tax=Phytophthora sojae (strain P6497) TaxID=1094619 RepID=G4ZCE8_PHYSP|nr:hypothetical protein PHYSODRAFT_330518 [Phytophthora sojae]EGZ16441.1 hypothetical protein PHYSODRAFT_330518 [Phytophthora sojae]|eukprot:XP_009525499.1 hypothetical protein PHYSODRAFT_330518 [Phytophthora sojae]